MQPPNNDGISRNTLIDEITLLVKNHFMVDSCVLNDGSCISNHANDDGRVVIAMVFTITNQDNEET